MMSKMEHNNIGKSLNGSKILYIAINIVVFTTMLILNMAFPIYADDYGYIGGKGRVDLYYLYEGGHIFSHVLIYLFAGLNERVFDVINSLVFILMLNVLYAFGRKDHEIDNTYLCIVIAFLWFFIPTFGGITLWMTSALSYMWMETCLILFILLLANHTKRKSDAQKDSIISMVFIFVVGILGGNSSEPLVCALFLMLMIMIYMQNKNNTLVKYDIVAVAGFIIGFALLMFAPGNFVRASHVPESNNVLVKYMFRIARETYYTFRYMMIPTGIALAMDFYSHINEKKSKNEHKCSLKQFLIQILNDEARVYIIVAFLSIYAMTFSPGFAYRIFLAPLLFLIMSIGVSYRKIKSEGRLQMLPLQIFVMCVMILCCVQIFTASIRCKQTGEPLLKDIGYNMEDEINNFIK